LSHGLADLREQLHERRLFLGIVVVERGKFLLLRGKIAIPRVGDGFALFRLHDDSLSGLCGLRGTFWFGLLARRRCLGLRCRGLLGPEIHIICDSNHAHATAHATHAAAHAHATTHATHAAHHTAAHATHHSTAHATHHAATHHAATHAATTKINRRNDQV